MNNTNKSAKSKNVSVLDSVEFRTNSGAADACADVANGRRNRADIPQGNLFCLPAFDEHYSNGYRAAFFKK